MNQKKINTILFLVNLAMLVSIFFVVEHYRKEVFQLKKQIDTLEVKVINNK